MSTPAEGNATGVLLLTFGSAVTSADVPVYLRSVRGGSEASPEVVAEFIHRFDAIGRSPLIDITARQAAALQHLLDERDGAGSHRVEMGMLHSPPSVADALQALRTAGVDRIVAVVMAPQYSPLILAGYQRALDQLGPTVCPGIPITLAGAWHLTAGWIDSLAARLVAALAALGGPAAGVAVVFTAHSLPRPVVERDPGYLEQIHATIAAVAERASLNAEDWCFAYQSAGHTPEEWLTPDLLDVLPGLRAAGRSAVLVAPVQFVADHLEVLYDIDIAAAEQARAAGMAFHRIEMPNDSPPMIDALAAVVAREVVGAAV